MRPVVTAVPVVLLAPVVTVARVRPVLRAPIRPRPAARAGPVVRPVTVATVAWVLLVAPGVAPRPRGLTAMAARVARPATGVAAGPVASDTAVRRAPVRTEVPAASVAWAAAVVPVALVARRAAPVAWPARTRPAVTVVLAATLALVVTVARA